MTGDFWTGLTYMIGGERTGLGCLGGVPPPLGGGGAWTGLPVMIGLTSTGLLIGLPGLFGW